MNQPQEPAAQNYPEKSPKSSRLTRNTRSAILVIVVLIASIVGSFFYVESQPKIAIKGFGTSWIQSDKECSSGNHEISNGNWSAILVNTGGSGFADLGFYIDGLQVTRGGFNVPAHSETVAQQSLSINGCYHISANPPNYDVVILSQRAAWLTWASLTTV